MTKTATDRKSSWPVRLEGLFAVAVAVVGLVVVADLAVLNWRRPDLSLAVRWIRLSDVGYFGPWLAIVLIVVLRGEVTRPNRALALSMALFGLQDTLASLPHGARPLSDAGFNGLLTVLYALAAGFGLRSTQLFPEPLTATEFSTPARVFTWLPWLRRGLRLLLRPWATWGLVLLITAALVLGPSWWDPVASLLIMAIGGAYWYVQWRVGDELRRRRVAWFLQLALIITMAQLIRIAVLAGGGVALNRYIALVIDWALAFGVNFCLAMAIFRAGAVNSNLIVQRTLVYGAAVAILVFAVEVTIHFALDEMKDWLGVSDRLIAAVLGAAGGLAYHPLTHRLRHLLHRFGEQHVHAHEHGRQIPAVEVEVEAVAD